jgi:hypothetical protein
MDEDDDFAEAPPPRGTPRGTPRPRRAKPSTSGLQQHPATVRRICELGREAHTHQQISAALHAEGLLNSKGGLWTRTTDGKVTYPPTPLTLTLTLTYTFQCSRPEHGMENSGDRL